MKRCLYDHTIWMLYGKKTKKLEIFHERALATAYLDRFLTWWNHVNSGQLYTYSGPYKTYKYSMRLHINLEDLNEMFFIPGLLCNLQNQLWLLPLKFNTSQYRRDTFKYLGSKLWNSLAFPTVNDIYDLNRETCTVPVRTMARKVP